MGKITTYDCIMILEKSLSNIEAHIDSLESGTLQVINSGVDMKYQSIEAAKLQYALTKGALAALIDYDLKFAALKKYEE